MGLETNHIVILFLISNSFNGFGFGLFLFSFGVGSSVVMGVAEGMVVCMAFGIMFISVSFVGCHGAIAQNSKKLNSYASATIILTVAEIVHLVLLSKGPINHNDILLLAYFVTMIFIIVVSIVSIMLSSIISFRLNRARLLAELAGKKDQHPSVQA